MNPNTCIRPWLLACGAQYGIRQAHEYRWDDAETRQQEMYFTYQSVDGDNDMESFIDLSSASDSTAVRHVQQEFQNRYQIDLYRSKNGLFELQAISIAARLPVFQRLFKAQGVSFGEVISIENMTPIINEEEIIYHFRMICTFREIVYFQLDENNAIVNQVDLTMESGDPTYEITRDGITVT